MCITSQSFSCVGLKYGMSVILYCRRGFYIYLKWLQIQILSIPMSTLTRQGTKNGFKIQRRRSNPWRKELYNTLRNMRAKTLKGQAPAVMKLHGISENSSIEGNQSNHTFQIRNWILKPCLIHEIYSWQAKIVLKSLTLIFLCLFRIHFTSQIHLSHDGQTRKQEESFLTAQLKRLHTQYHDWPPCLGFNIVS